MSVGAYQSSANFTVKIYYEDMGSPPTGTAENDAKLGAVAAVLSFVFIATVVGVAYYAWKQKQLCWHIDIDMDSFVKVSLSTFAILIVQANREVVRSVLLTAIIGESQVTMRKISTEPPTRNPCHR